MQIDSTALAILDRKCLRLAKFGEQQDYIGWLSHLTPLIRWVWSVPILRAYVRQIIAMHDDAERALDRETGEWLREIGELVEHFRSDVKTSSEVEDKWIEQHTWRRILASLASARASTTSFEDRRTFSKDAATGLHSHARQANFDAFAAIDRASKAVKDAKESLSAAMTAADDHPGLDARIDFWEGAVSDAKAVEASGRSPIDALSTGSTTQIHRVDEWDLMITTSPRTALRRLVAACRSQSPPVEGVKHWTDFLPQDPFGDAYNHLALRSEYANVYGEARDDLPLFVEELHVLGASTLSHRVLIERFKERCTWYDKDRMREVANFQGAGREDRLTLELAKYLHDSGVFVLVRARVSNLEPDAFSIRGLAVESKAYIDSSSSRADIIGAFSQLHAYMTSLETDAMRVSEGFVVAFRLGGPIYETPPTIETGRFLIHSMTIDLGESRDSGRNQPATKKITEKEIFEAFEVAAPPAPTP